MNTSDQAFCQSCGANELEGQDHAVDCTSATIDLREWLDLKASHAELLSVLKALVAQFDPDSRWEAAAEAIAKAENV